MEKKSTNEKTVNGDKLEETDYGLRPTFQDSEKKKTDLLQIKRTAILLTCISNGISSLSDITEYCRLNKSTVHRLLKALVNSNFVIYNQFSHRYLIGELITKVASKPEVTHEYLIMCARKEMERIADITGETVLLGVLNGQRNLVVQTIGSNFEIRVVENNVYKQVPYYVGAASYSLFSQLNEEELKIVYKFIKLEQSKNSVIPDMVTLKKCIMEVREKGYAISKSERIAGAMCISVPVRNYFLPANISVLGLEMRMNEQAASIIDLMVTNADRISSNLKRFFTA